MSKRQRLLRVATRLERLANKGSTPVAEARVAIETVLAYLQGAEDKSLKEIWDVLYDGSMMPLGQILKDNPEDREAKRLLDFAELVRGEIKDMGQAQRVLRDKQQTRGSELVKIYRGLAEG